MKLMKLTAAFLVIILTMSCKSQKETVTTENRTQLEPRQRKSAERNRQGTKARMTVDEVFKMDANGDGKLAKTEVKGRMAKDFERFDTDKDGLISREEFENAPRPKKGQRRTKG